MSKPIREEQLPPDDKVVEMAPNIRRIQLPMNMPGLGHVNCYILDDDRGAALLDPGLPGPASWKALKLGLKQAELPPERVHTILVTHSHPDHFGAAGRFCQEYGAELITHRNFRLWWDVDEEDEHPLEPVHDTNNDTGVIAEVDEEDPEVTTEPLHEISGGGPSGPTPWGGKGYKLPWHRRLSYEMMKKGWGGRWFKTPVPTSRIDDADRIKLARREFVAIHTPGHTIDHLCLFDPETGVMLCGDHVLPTITPHISGITTAKDPLNDFFNSLDRVAELEGVELGLPAHGQPCMDLRGRVQDIKRHHNERLDVLREASDHLGHGSVQQYMKELFKERSWGSMAESETFAHLEHLRQIGEATARRHPSGIVEYSFN